MLIVSLTLGKNINDINCQVLFIWLVLIQL